MGHIDKIHGTIEYLGVEGKDAYLIKLRLSGVDEELMELVINRDMIDKGMRKVSD